MANFQRTKFYAYKKLGAGQKSKRKYRRATGRHNKTRQKWRCKPPMVEIGYKRKCSERGLINNKIPIMINNAKDLALIGKENIGIVAKIGRKKKIEIAKEAKLKNIEIYNLNINKINKLLKQNEIKNKNIEKLNNKENKNEKSK